jgi:hypothetical protein
MWWLFGGVVWLGVIVWLVITYQRRVGGRQRATDAQAERLMAEVRAGKGAQAAASAPVGTVPVPVASGALAPALAAAVSGPQWHSREHLLDPPRGLIYLLLRTGLPDHEIFANLTLADVASVGAQWQGFEREQRARRLQQTRVDFVVCTRRLQPVAVVLLREAVSDAAVVERLRFTEECLTAAGVRHVSFDPAALPRHGELRALVLGEP